MDGLKIENSSAIDNIIDKSCLHEWGYDIVYERNAILWTKLVAKQRENAEFVFANGVGWIITYISFVIIQSKALNSYNYCSIHYSKCKGKKFSKILKFHEDILGEWRKFSTSNV